MLRTLGRIFAVLLAAPLAAAFAAVATSMVGIAFHSQATTVPLPYAVLAVVLFAAVEACAVALWIAVVEQPPGGRR